MDDLAFIALGSNLGNSVETISAAIKRLQDLSHKPIVASSLWRTTPVDCPPGSPAFINAAAALVPLPEETPETLLAKLQEIEKVFGRQAKTIHNEARPLDLDLIAFGNETRSSAHLTLPHPRAHERKFVLQPLSEIAPTFIFPSVDQTVATLLANLQTDEVLVRIS